jgi:hypothetical protein
MATVTHDELWLCEDCHMAASGANVTIIDQEQAKATEEGLARLAKLGHLVPDSNGETGEGCDVFLGAPCACCQVRRRGLFNRYAILGDDCPNQDCPTHLDSAACHVDGACPEAQ